MFIADFAEQTDWPIICLYSATALVIILLYTRTRARVRYEHLSEFTRFSWILNLLCKCSDEQFINKSIHIQHFFPIRYRKLSQKEWIKKIIVKECTSKFMQNIQNTFSRMDSWTMWISEIEISRPHYNYLQYTKIRDLWIRWSSSQ